MSADPDLEEQATAAPESPLGVASAERNPTIRLELNAAVIKRLRLDEPPVGYDPAGKVIFGHDLTRTSFIVDSSAKLSQCSR